MLITQPPLIEQSTFTGGWSPDGTDAFKDATALIDENNLLLDRTRVTTVTQTGAVREVPSGGMVTRKGFKRLLEEMVADSSHWVRSIHPFRTATTNYLIVVITDGTGAANNVQLWAVTLSSLTPARIDTPGHAWTKPLSSHWGQGVDGIYYGGTSGEAMYSWDPAIGWNADAATNPNWKTVLDAVNDAVTTATQYGRDFAFKGKEVVTYLGKQYTPSRNIRYENWDADERTYQVGDRVSRYATWGATSTYYKSFRCIEAHSPSDLGPTSHPGTGATWKTYWTKVRLPLPSINSETTAGWDFVPVAAETHIAAWHADRMFMRYDNQGDKSRLLYSAPIKPDKSMDVPDVSWDPTDFAPGNDFRGIGGGWIPFNDGTHPGPIQALHSYNTYLVVFKRQAVWVLAGTDDTTWQTRRLVQGVGCVGPKAKVTHNDIVYFLADDGLYITDGTSVQEAPGNQKVREYLRARMDASLPGRPENEPVMWSFGGFVWFSVPDSSMSSYVTIAYDPDTASFWKTNLPVEDAAVYRHEGVNKLAFGAPITYGSTRSLVYQYDHPTANNQDDTGLDVYAGTGIAWNARMSWWPFGTVRQQRRIRRVWALVRGWAGLQFTIKARRDYSETVVKSTNRTPNVADPVYIEGEWFADSHAVNFELSASSAPATVLGIGVDTQPRRDRYHN